MPAYFSLGAKNSEFVSDRYLHINNCGFCEDMDKTAISRPQGRKDYQLIYIRSGQMEFEENGQTQLLADENVYLYRPGTPQRYRINGVKTTFFWIHFTGSAAPEILKGIPDGRIKTGFFHSFETFCKSMYMACRTSLQPNLLLFEGELISLIAFISEKARSNPSLSYNPQIAPALIAMNRSLTARLSNEELAQQCGLSRYYFIKLFKKATGCTPQQYYTQQAIETAKDLLENTDNTVAQIASLCGIEDNFYFSRVFKKHTGLSPADYRRSLHLGFVDNGKFPTEKVDKSRKM